MNIYSDKYAEGAQSFLMPGDIYCHSEFLTFILKRLLKQNGYQYKHITCGIVFKIKV